MSFEATSVIVFCVVMVSLINAVIAFETNQRKAVMPWIASAIGWGLVLMGRLW